MGRRLAADPEFRFFMLDGQTIVLDDYRAIRPEREAEIRPHVQAGRQLLSRLAGRSPD